MRVNLRACVWVARDWAPCCREDSSTCARRRTSRTCSLISASSSASSSMHPDARSGPWAEPGKCEASSFSIPTPIEASASSQPSSYAEPAMILPCHKKLLLPRHASMPRRDTLFLLSPSAPAPLLPGVDSTAVILCTERAAPKSLRVDRSTSGTAWPSKARGEQN